MADRPFVGRDDELARLEHFLDAALAGRGQVCFVAGEPGAGKTALVREFARRSQARYDDLLVAVGNCNAQTGQGEAFLPFREVLGLLTGEAEAQVTRGALTPEGARRVDKFLATSVQVLITTAPDLISLIPGFSAVVVAARVGAAVLKHAGLDAKLTALNKRHEPKPGLPQPTITRENIFEQYTRFLVELAARQPLVLVLDDLQWTDVSSADLLFHLVRRIDACRVLIVGAYRPGDVAAAAGPYAAEGHPLERVQAEIKRYQGDVSIDLDARDPARGRRFVHALVDAEPNALLSDFREALYERTQGNPLFVIELLRDLRERGYLRQNGAGEWIATPALDWQALPARVEGVIEGRIGRLEKELREMLSAASVEGEEFTAEALARVTAAGERETVRRLSEDLARQHRLVDPSGVVRLAAGRISRYHFHHRLLREYFYDRLDAAEQAYLHEDVGRALEALYAGQTDDVAVQLAWHFSEAGLDQKAVPFYRRAGELAAAAFANDEAAAHFTHAFGLTPEQDLRPRFELLLARENIYDRQGRRQEQGQDLAAAARLAVALNDLAGQAEVNLRQANLDRVTGRYASAAQHAQAASEQAARAGEQLVETQGYAMLGLVLRHQGRFAEAGEWLALALDQAQALGEDALAAQLTYWTGLNHYSADQLDLAGRSVLAAADAFELRSDNMGQANCALLLGDIAVRQGDIGAAIQHLESALAACRRCGWRSREAIVVGDLANVHLEVGGYEASRRYQLLSLEIAREVADREGEAVSLDSLGLVEQQLGHHDAAIALFLQALVIARDIGYRRGEGYVLTHLGYSHLELGKTEAARQWLNDATAIRTDLAERVPTLVDDLAALARVELARGNDGRAFACASEALDRLASQGPEGVEYPVRAYLDCWRVLGGVEGPEAADRAGQALADGYRLLQERAGRLDDATLRRSFLEDVPFNRELCAVYESRPARR